MLGRLILVGVATALALGVCAGGAAATTFSGDCTMQGTMSMESTPYGWVPQNRDYQVSASGRCVGTVDGRPYDGTTHLSLDGRMDKPMSCTFGYSTNVPGVLTFGSDPTRVDATRLDVVVNEFNVSADLPFEMTGAYNGLAAGNANVLKEMTQENFEACTRGDLGSLDFDMFMRTIRPLYG